MGPARAEPNKPTRTMNIETESSQSNVGGRPNAGNARRQQILAIAMLVILVGGAVGFGFWHWQSNRLPDEVLIDPPTGRGMMGGNITRIPEPPRDGVRKTG